MAASSIHRHPPSLLSTAVKQQQPLFRRLLFPTSTSIDLPPLLASPSTPPELTTELYDFIALALRAFVNPWWTKITRYDKEFLPEITRIITVVVRVLEARVQAADLSLLVFRDIPILITQHYQDYRNASSKLSTAYATGGAASLPQLFHQLQPHLAVSADGRIEPEYFRQVFDHILKTCLPPEDYAPEPERFIIREIMLKVVLDDVVPKITQPWFIQKTILDQLYSAEDKAQPLEVPDPPSTLPNSSSTFSFHALLIIFLSAIQSLSGACLALIHAYKQAINTIKLVNNSHPHLDAKSVPLTTDTTPPREPISPTQPQSQTASDPPDLLRDPFTFTVTPSTSSSTSSLPTVPPSPSSPVPLNTRSDHESLNDHDYSHAPLMMLSEIFTTDTRFASSTIMVTLRMLSVITTSFLDRLLPHFLHTTLSAQFVTDIVRTAKRTLFPNGYPVPAPPDPTPEEQAEMRERLLAWRGRGGPFLFAPLILGSDPSRTISDALDPLSSAPCNVHLVVIILDRILVALFPELGGSVATDSSQKSSLKGTQ